MTHKYFTILAGGVLSFLLLLLTDPFMVWMPEGMYMLVLLASAACAVVWCGFIFYERPHDERESQHVMHAGRIAYLLGVAVLGTALVVQGFAHAIDPWISGALGVMVLGKLGAHLYLKHYK